ncbi:alpha/beta hydrolase [Commensalibacter oyaizuii]|uniref:Alpha/beta hydrolase n=1 Tax=Commensalibacter oyaizuii TaxID=3043873 RepID=A0ABT6Q378_9PROT|nr:alpha/beta hydrolase [Commensalibacter sp. TBRC 16381]MDI2091568.1 alpha/beta hydrolase [Commensalibacter sp. TBRC 16381]
MPEVMFAGPAGRLEGRYHHSNEPNAPLALILHPHPLQGGTMNNRITYTMYQTFQRLGFSVLRYNSRGVGRSQGQYDGGIGEISDAAAALDWLQMANTNSRELWISGYSFGAFVGMQLLMRRPEIQGWISVAPLANHYDFNFLAPCPCGGLMIAGEADTVVPVGEIDKLVEKLNAQKGISVDYHVLPKANHIFANDADKIAQAIEKYVHNIVEQRKNTPLTD